MPKRNINRRTALIENSIFPGIEVPGVDTGYLLQIVKGFEVARFVFIVGNSFCFVGTYPKGTCDFQVGSLVNIYFRDGDRRKACG